MVHGVSSLDEYLHAISECTLDGRLAEITCPTLLCAAENDPLSASAPKVRQQLTAPTAALQFLGSEGAGDHCEMNNRAVQPARLRLAGGCLRQSLGPPGQPNRPEI
jgi:hypothetical protein